MNKRFILLFLVFTIVVIIVALFVTRKTELERIDVTKVDFDYDLDVCSDYFELVECVIDNDPDVNYTNQMRIDLKNEVRQMQEYWKSLSEDELSKKCNEELDRFSSDSVQEKLRSFGCSINI